ncbi:MAG: hypothetical protein R2828_26070 [Saprospiraceae bacterium]
MKDYRKYFIKFIKENYPIEFENIISITDEHYKTISIDTTFAQISKNPMDKRLDFSSYFLALIKTLDERNEEFEHIEKFAFK